MPTPEGAITKLAGIIEGAVISQSRVYYIGDEDVEDHVAVCVDGCINFVEVANQVMKYLEASNGR